MTVTRSITLISGATSGIGRSLAYAIGRGHGRVVVTSRRWETLARVARNVEAFGGEALAIRSDVCDPSSIADAVERTLERWGRIDTAIISSGIALRLDTSRLTVEPFRDLVETNVMGVVNWLTALQPVMTSQENGGTIAVISSLAADRAWPGPGAAYSMTKAAVSQLFDGLRAPLAEQGIRLVTIEPGFVETAMTENLKRKPLNMRPELAAEIILSGLTAGKPVIRFPLMASALMGALKLLPSELLDRLYSGDDE